MQSSPVRESFRDRYDPVQYVYFVQAEDTRYYKIGYTTQDPEDRLKQLSTSSPHQLRIKGVVPFASREGEVAEQKLHDELDDCRLNGEWFEMTDRECKEAWSMAREWSRQSDLEWLYFELHALTYELRIDHRLLVEFFMSVLSKIVYEDADILDTMIQLVGKTDLASDSVRELLGVYIDENYESGE